MLWNKAVSKFYFITAQEVVLLRAWSFYTVGLTKARIGFVEDSSSQQTETTVSNKNECITKIATDETSIPRFAKLQSELNAITWFNQHKWF